MATALTASSVWQLDQDPSTSPSDMRWPCEVEVHTVAGPVYGVHVDAPQGRGIGDYLSEADQAPKATAASDGPASPTRLRRSGMMT